VVADPNTPPQTQQINVRVLTTEETTALQVNGTTLEALVGVFIEQEMPRQVTKAKTTLAKTLTITELQNAKK